MSAINPVIQTPPRLNPDQFNAGTGQTSAPAAQQGFSNTLNSVGAKPVRKGPSNKPQQSPGGGDTLPASGNPSPPATPTASAASPAPAGTTSAVIGTAAPSTASAGTGNAAVPSPAAAANAAQAAPAATATIGQGPAAVTADNGAAAAEAPGSQNSPSGSAGQDPLSAAADAAALAASAQTAAPATGAAPPAADGTPSVPGAGAASNAATADPAPAVKAAAKDATSAPSNWVGGRAAAAMRAVYPTGNSGATTSGRSTVDGQAQDPLSSAAPGTSTAVPSPPAQVDTAAMIGAMQAAAPLATATSGDTAPVAPPGNPSDIQAGPLKALAANGDAPAALPALAAAAASAAQVVSTVAAGAAADKKSHDSQSQIAASSAAASTADAAGAAQLLSAPGANHTDTGAVPTLKVNAPVDSPEFGQNVASHLSTMLDGSVNSAKLQVTPPALGPIEVRISIQGDHAQVWMASHSAMTRDALQDAAPQLREMLNSQGFAQVSVDISQRSFQERTPSAHAYEWNGESHAGATSAAGSSAVTAGRTSSGTLDAYA